jgi:hypothetical protein
LTVVVVTGSSRTSLIATRASSELKRRFAALAAAQGQSESALLTLLIETVLEQNGTENLSPPMPLTERAQERITIRLRESDRRLLERRASRREMKPATYLVMLVRAHLREDRPLPLHELNELKMTVARISALDRHLQRLTAEGPTSVPWRAADIGAALSQASAEVREVRRFVSAIVQSNLLSWEVSDG